MEMTGDLAKNSFIDERSKALLERVPVANGRVEVEVASINSFKEVWCKKERNGTGLLEGKENCLISF